MATSVVRSLSTMVRAHQDEPVLVAIGRPAAKRAEQLAHMSIRDFNGPHVFRHVGMKAFGVARYVDVAEVKKHGRRVCLAKYVQSGERKEHVCFVERPPLGLEST